MIEQVLLSCEPLGRVAVIRASGSEAMSELPTWSVDVLSGDPSCDLAKLIGAPAVLVLGDAGGGTRPAPLIVCEASYAGAHRDGHRYRLELSVRASKLMHRAGHRIFQALTTQEIVDKILKDAGIAAREIVWRLAGRYQQRTYCVQLGETEWDFIRRLLADDGINVWFDHTAEGEPRLVFGDGPSAHDSIEGPVTVAYQDASGMATSAASFFALARTCEITHDRVEVRDFDVRAPDVPVVGTAGDGSREWFEYPACVLNAEVAAARARVRLEQLGRARVRLDGQSACARLHPGRVVRIEGAADDMFSGDFLIVRVEHALVAPSKNDSSTAHPYTNRVELVPFDKDHAFRPDLPHAPPRIAGIETAVVTGPSGEEIHVDDLGSIKVRFRWDRSGKGDDTSSLWVRCLQMNMQGSMLLPRVGWEVPVVHFDGDPDRPFVVGRLYNGGAPAPYGMPGKKATSTLQSATSPSNGTTQEIRMGDDAGSQEVFIHATKDQSVTVGGTNTVNVAADETHDVKKSSVIAVHGSQTTSIGGSQSITVGADLGIGVKGGRVESIGGVETIGVTGSYNLACKGAYAEVVGGLYGLECNQSNTVIQGAFTQTVGGPMVLTAGLGTNNSVAAVRTEVVGGARSYTALASYADNVKGAKKVTSGASSDTAGTDIVTHVSGIGSVKVGGTASLSAGGTLAVEAPTITIKVGGAVTAKGGGTLKVAGKVQVSGGTAKFDAAKTQKKSTAKVG